MSKLGNLNITPDSKRSTISIIRHSYVYKLIKRLLSFISTMLLISLLILGASMYYFNMKAQSAQKQGIHYNPPFGLYTIISGSMEPKVHVYDVVLSTEVKDLSTIKSGDIITFISTWDVNYGTTVTHRVINVSKAENGEYRFTTKGDANQLQDGAYVTGENLIGKVALRLPQLGRVQFFLATKAGWFIVVFVPAMAVIVWDIVKIFRLKVLKEELNEIENVKDLEKKKKKGKKTPELDTIPEEEKKEIKRKPISRKK